MPALWHASAGEGPHHGVESSRGAQWAACVGGFRYGVTPRGKVARPTGPAGCAPRSTSHLDAPPFPPLASLARRTPPPLGAPRVPQRPAAAVHLPLPLLLRRRADRRCAKSAISTGTLAVPMRADASASSRCQWLHGPTCTPLGPPRPLSTARCDSPVPQPTTPRS